MLLKLGAGVGLTILIGGGLFTGAGAKLGRELVAGVEYMLCEGDEVEFMKLDDEFVNDD